MRTAFHRILACLVFMGAVCTALPSAAFAVTNAGKTRSCIGGTFIQLTDGHRGWTEMQWDRLLASFKKIRMSHIVLQWTVYDTKPFFTLGVTTGQATTPIETILKTAEKHGIKVLVGLVHDSGYWEEIAKEPDSVERYLEQLQQRSIATAEDLEKTVSKYRSFAGWYISQEIDDRNWNGERHRQIVSRFLAGTSAGLHAMHVKSKIAVSGFASETTDPATVKEMWTDLFQQAPKIDVLFFQDGIGVEKLKLATLPAYLSAVQEAARLQSRSMYPVIEIFRQTEGEPVSTGEFKAVPAPLARIKQQLAIASRYSTFNIAFSVPEYMSSSGQQGAKELYRQYRKEIGRRGHDCS